MNNDETIKLMAETLRNGLTKFIGSPATEASIAEMKWHMTYVLNSFIAAAGLSPVVLPEISITIYGSEANFSFSDPKTKEAISLDIWISRATEGFYD